MKIVNKTGYLKGAKTAKNPVNIIPSNVITTQGMAFPIKANGKTLYPNTGQYKFPTSSVVETPLKQKGTKGAKPNPIPTPSLGSAFFNPNKSYNNIYNNPFTAPIFQDEMDRKLAESPIIKKAKQSAVAEESRRTGNFPKASGRVDMTMSPIDAAIAAQAGLIGGTARLLGGALNASIPGTGITANNAFGALSGYNFGKRLGEIPSNVANKNWEAATKNTLMLPVDVAGMTGLNGFKTDKIENTVNVVKNYGKDLIEASKEAGKFKFPTYSNTYRWHADEIPEGLKAASSKLTAEQKTHTGKWFASDINEIPFYTITRPSAGSLKTYRTSDIKLNKLKDAMPESARGMSGTNNTVASQKYKHPAEFLLPDSEVGKVKNIRFNKNPAVTASEKPDVAKILNDPNLADAKEYKRNALSHYILPELKQATQGLNKPILGINRKYFPFKKGTKTIKYKEGSKGVSLAFSRGEKDPKGGLTQKGVDKYNRATGGNLKMAVTTPPSKLKPGSKAAKRRKSFCSRMKGMKSKLTSAKTANNPNSRINKSLRKWNC